MPVDGRDTPDCAAAGDSPQTLMSLLRSLYGDVANSTSINFRASRSNFGRSASGVAVAENQQIELHRRIAGFVES